MANPLKFDRTRPLFLLPRQQLPIESAALALEEVYQQGAPVLIYIHGRAKRIGEPRKSVEQDIYTNLGRYGVATLGFTWDADDGGYDESRAIASADDFNRFLELLAEYLRANPAKHRPSLLAHSMGNLIISELAKDGLLSNDRGHLFENIILSSPAVKQKRHHRWLQDIGVSQRRYVMINPSDPMLKFAGFGLKPDMLGENLKSPGVSPDQATYVSVARLAVKHRYFVKPGQRKQANLYDFYEQATTGKEVEFASIAEPDSIDGVPVQAIKPIARPARANNGGSGSPIDSLDIG